MMEIGPQPETKSADVEKQGEPDAIDLSKETIDTNKELIGEGRCEHKPEGNVVDSNPLQNLTDSGG